MATKPTKATISFDNDKAPVELPILSGTLGNDVIDIRTLGKHGIYTYDPGFLSTGSCSSDITFINGEKGLLYHRGYPIEQLAENCTFLEVAHLLIKGELPNLDERKKWSYAIERHTMLHDQMDNVFRGFRRDAHPMAVMVSVVGAMAAFYPENTNVSDPTLREIAAIRLLAKAPTIAAMVDAVTRFDTAAADGVSIAGSARASCICRHVSAALCSRRFGSLLRHRRRSFRISFGVLSGNASQSGSDFTMAARVSVTVSPRKVFLQVSASYRQHPKAQISVRLSTAFPRACSGLI